MELAGEDETFDWLPQASELGWPGTAHPTADADPVRPDTTVLLAHELSDHTPAYTWGEAARIAVRAASIGYGLAATIHADSLDEVFDALRRPPVRLADDELSHLGVVARPAPARRRSAARRGRPLRPAGRPRRRTATSSGSARRCSRPGTPRRDEFEHFGWGVTPELARRIGRHAGDFEIEVERRREHLDRLVATGVTEPQPARDAIRAYRPAPAVDAPGGDA